MLGTKAALAINNNFTFCFKVSEMHLMVEHIPIYKFNILHNIPQK